MSTPAGFDDPAGTWNCRYAGDDFLFGTEPNAWLREHAHALPAGGRVLCVADGEGRNSVWLAQQGHTVEAFDIAERAVDKARAGPAAGRAGVVRREAFAALHSESLCDHEAEVQEGSGQSGRSALIGLVARR